MCLHTCLLSYFTVHHESPAQYLLLEEKVSSAVPRKADEAASCTAKVGAAGSLLSRQVQQILGDMAVAAGVFVQILLVVFLRGVEILDGLQLHQELRLVFLLLQGVAGFDLRQLLRLGVVDAGTGRYGTGRPCRLPGDGRRWGPP